MSGEKQLEGVVSGLSANAVSVWREAMGQLRQLHGDVWNGVRFFLAVNGVIIAAFFAIAGTTPATILTGSLLSGLAILGLALTLVARQILTKHRRYYLDMLLRKTLIDLDLGFYGSKIHGVTLSLPWMVAEADLSALQEDPGAWLQHQERRKGTITRLLFLVYEGVAVVHAVLLMLVLVGFTSGYFR